MSYLQNRVFLLLKRNTLLEDSHPIFVQSFADEDEAIAEAGRLNEQEEQIVEAGFPVSAVYRYGLKTVWL